MVTKSIAHLATVVFVLALAAGCSPDMLGTEPLSTTTPTSQEVDFCRHAMFIRSAAEIEPVGFFRQPDFQFDAVVLKFHVKTPDIESVFKPEFIAPLKFSKRESLPGFGRTVAAQWWDTHLHELTGFDCDSLPANECKTRALSVGVAKSAGDEYTVYAYARVNYE